MFNRAQPKWTTVIALSVIVASILALVILLPQFIEIVIAVSSLPPSQAQPAPTITAITGSALIQARAVLARVQDEIIPREGQSTSYGVTFSDVGYQTLVQWNRDYKVEPHYAEAFESLDMLLPCCTWHTPSRDEETNCACGHHQALEGLSKKLLSEGWDSRAVQGEVTQWTRFMFPLESLSTEMQQRGLLDPDMQTALDELKARGAC